MLREDELFVLDLIESFDTLPAFTEALGHVLDYASEEYLTAKGKYWQTKNDRLDAWAITKEQIYEIVIGVFNFYIINRDWSGKCGSRPKSSANNYDIIKIDTTWL